MAEKKKEAPAISNSAAKPSFSPLRSRVSSLADSFSNPESSWGSSLLKQFAIFSALFLAAALLFWFLSPSFLPKPSWEYFISEEPLVKNTPLQLHPGDYLVYSAKFNGNTQMVRLDASLRSGCRGVFLADSSAMARLSNLPAAQAPSPSSYSVCLGMDGTERDSAGMPAGNNVSFSNLSWPYFQPWMLALQDGWKWSINTTLRVQPYNLSYSRVFVYTMLGRVNESGREAFLVEVTSQPSSAGQASLPSPTSTAGIDADSDGPIRLLIDAQKRVLIKGEFSNTSISLVEASFPIK